MQQGIQRTFVMVKPDGVRRQLMGEILKRFEKRGLTLVAAKMAVADQKLAEDHYIEHQGDGKFFIDITKSLQEGPVMALVFEGEQAIVAARQTIGQPSPLQSMPGTIRGDYALYEPMNVVHGSDSIQAADREIKLWFGNDTQLINKKQLSAKVTAPWDNVVLKTNPKSAFGKFKLIAPAEEPEFFDDDGEEPF